MRRTSTRRDLNAVVTLAGVLAAGSAAHGATNMLQRHQTTLRGDFVLIGNTLGYDAGPVGGGVPVVGSVGATGLNISENAPDVYWRSNAPVTGQAQANNALTAAQARSQAVLNIPPGATIRYARLYWAATASGAAPDTQVTLSRLGAGGFSTTVTADAFGVSGVNDAYQSTADVTALVQSAGPGAFQVEDVDIVPWVDLNNANVFAGWSMVVVYARPTDPPREITIHDGIGLVNTASPAVATISRVQPLPPTGIAARLGVVAYEGDNSNTQDSCRLNGNGVSDAQNPVGNFFNGTRGFLGLAATVPGDLPQMSGAAGSMCGIDIDVVDVTAFAPAQGVATVQFTVNNNSDLYQSGYVVLSTSVPFACVGDLNNDGVVNTADLALFLGAFGQTVPAFTGGDLNGDGVVNTVDLAQFLAAFGSNCP
ncbi:MAG: dockerin type I repeat-containing protein [Planctomycetes bacterium]|nr:dockerin type I repeat-containing protein [Planctomycetota bacterium]